MTTHESAQKPRTSRHPNQEGRVQTTARFATQSEALAFLHGGATEYHPGSEWSLLCARSENAVVRRGSRPFRVVLEYVSAEWVARRQRQRHERRYGRVSLPVLLLASAAASAICVSALELLGVLR